MNSTAHVIASRRRADKTKEVSDDLIVDKLAIQLTAMPQRGETQPICAGNLGSF